MLMSSIYFHMSVREFWFTHSYAREALALTQVATREVVTRVAFTVIVVIEYFKDVCVCLFNNRSQ